MRFLCLEKTIDLASLDINVDVEIARSCGEARNSLDISSKSIPAIKLAKGDSVNNPRYEETYR